MIQLVVGVYFYQPIFTRVASLAIGWSQNFPSANEVSLKNAATGEHNEAQHRKQHIFLVMHCSTRGNNVMHQVYL